jgi:hypothetical protein
MKIQVEYQNGEKRSGEEEEEAETVPMMSHQLAS